MNRDEEQRQPPSNDEILNEMGSKSSSDSIACTDGD